MMKTLSGRAKDLKRLIIVNTLDSLYFWMYQPRSRKALSILLQDMSIDWWANSSPRHCHFILTSLTTTWWTWKN